MSSNALTQFVEHLGMSSALLELEQAFDDPPPEEKRTTARALRGGAVVLMVAAFENFLKGAIQEHVTPLTQVHFSQLAPQIRQATVFSSLKRAMEGPRHGGPPGAQHRLPDIEAECRRIADGVISPSGLAHSRSNPNSETVKELFKRLALTNVFGVIKPLFDSRWPTRHTADTFVQDKLDEIVNLRHKVAHTADTLNISRPQLKEAVTFLELLARVLDVTLKQHVVSQLPQVGTPTGSPSGGAGYSTGQDRLSADPDVAAASEASSFEESDDEDIDEDE